MTRDSRTRVPGTNCGAFSIALFDINNAGEAPADIEVDDDLFAIVEQYWNWINNARTGTPYRW